MTWSRRDVGSPDPDGEFLRYRTLGETAGDPMFVLRALVGGAVEQVAAADRLTVGVVDEGAGIPEAELAVLADGEETDPTDGIGLGLWLAKWAVEPSCGETAPGTASPVVPRASSACVSARRDTRRRLRASAGSCRLRGSPGQNDTDGRQATSEHERGLEPGSIDDGPADDRGDERPRQPEAREERNRRRPKPGIDHLPDVRERQADGELDREPGEQEDGDESGDGGEASEHQEERRGEAEGSEDDGSTSAAEQPVGEQPAGDPGEDADGRKHSHESTAHCE
jgi:hypothetical protein